MPSPRRRLSLAVALATAVGSIAIPALSTVAQAQSDTTEHSVLVLAKDGASDASVRAAIAASGGTVTEANTAIGLYTVSTARSGFESAVRGQAAVSGTATDTVIGHAPKDAAKKLTVDAFPTSTYVGRSTPVKGTPTAPTVTDPLTPLQWDMDLIHAPQAHAIAQGEGVRVGIMDTGVDASHPDIAANFDHRLSRNFTTDDPTVDGTCDEDPDGSCTDPADVDENGHGTHVASTIASPINGAGIVGVAPRADIVNLRAGQDSGYFFLAPTVNALTYAGDNGIDVVNMSFYIDPWLYNCAANPADSPAEQQEQRTIIAATNRALNYAYKRGVTLVAAAGNEHTDLNNPTLDSSSPDYPDGAAKTRTVDNSCLTMPTEGDNVIGVSAVGPSTLKADYSNWGSDGVEVAAPGGYYRDNYGTADYMKPGNLILAAMPKGVGIEEGTIDPVTGEPTTPMVIKSCTNGSCGYYQYLQGTSMAAPHATGVAALIISRYGHKDPKLGGVTLNPVQTGKILTRTATDTACPAPVYDYPDRPDAFTSACTGTPELNSWYGHGIVDALAAVTKKH